MSSVVETVTDLVTPILDEQNFELVEVEFVKEGKSWFLRVYIDKDGGVTIEDCEIVSRILEKKLDEADPIEQAYILEVSSPGIDRPLKKTEHFEKYIGEIIDIKLYKPIEGKKEYQGELKQFNDGVITIIQQDGKEIQFIQKETASVRLAVIF